MGLALLPWERLPAYVLGPLLALLSGWLLWIDTERTFVHVLSEIAGIVFAVCIVWHRYRTGRELFAAAKSTDKLP